MSDSRLTKTRVAAGVLISAAGACLWLWGLFALLSGVRSQEEIVRAVGAIHVGLVALCLGVLLSRYGLKHAASLPWGAARQWRFVTGKAAGSPRDHDGGNA